MIYLELSDVILLHETLLNLTGGAAGIRDKEVLRSAVIHPQMIVFERELYPTIEEKAAILGFGLITNHAFIDGNKRIGHAAMELFLVLNGFEIISSVDDQESIIFAVAAGQITKEEFTTWVKIHTQPKTELK